MSSLIAVFSDIHDHWNNLKWLMTEIKRVKPQALICCGDISSHETLEKLAALKIELHFCLGNTDEHDAQKFFDLSSTYNHLHFGARLGHADFEGRKIAFTHYPDTAAQIRDVDTVFFGHSHRRFKSISKGILLANPGDIQNRHGLGPSFILWDAKNNNVEFVIYNDP